MVNKWIAGISVQHKIEDRDPAPDIRYLPRALQSGSVSYGVRKLKGEIYCSADLAQCATVVSARVFV